MMLHRFAVKRAASSADQPLVRIPPTLNRIGRLTFHKNTGERGHQLEMDNDSSHPSTNNHRQTPLAWLKRPTMKAGVLRPSTRVIAVFGGLQAQERTSRHFDYSNRRLVGLQRVPLRPMRVSYRFSMTPERGG